MKKKPKPKRPTWIETPGGVAAALNKYDRIYRDGKTK